MMARIRTIKPDFFRHEVLQDLEIKHQGNYPMLVFIGLLGHCDNQGHFEWRPRQLKLDILPFLPFVMEETLLILLQAGMISSYSVNGLTFGDVPTFLKHQVLNLKEVNGAARCPAPCEDGADMAPATQEGKGMEGKGMELFPQSHNPAAALAAAPKKHSPPQTLAYAACQKTWEAYSSAYMSRYGEEPVQNKKVRAQIKQLVERIGIHDSPNVASFYLSHCSAYYVRKGHDVGSLLVDAEKIRTEWATGTMVTATAAHQLDRTQSTRSAASTALKMLHAEGIE